MKQLKKRAKKLWRMRAPIVVAGKMETYTHILRLDQQLKQVQAKLKQQRSAGDEQRSFRHDRYRYAERLFKPRNDATPTFDKEVCTTFFRETYSDETRDEPYLTAPPEITRPERPRDTV